MSTRAAGVEPAAEGHAKNVDGEQRRHGLPLLPDHAADGVSGLSDAEDGVAVDELDVAELGAAQPPWSDLRVWGHTSWKCRFGVAAVYGAGSHAGVPDVSCGTGDQRRRAMFGDDPDVAQVDSPARLAKATPLPIIGRVSGLPSPPRQNWLSANGIELVEPFFEPPTWHLHVPLRQGGDDVEAVGSRHQFELQPIWKLG